MVLETFWIGIWDWNPVIQFNKLCRWLGCPIVFKRDSRWRSHHQPSTGTPGSVINNWGHLTPGKASCSASSPAMYFLLHCCVSPPPPQPFCWYRRVGVNHCRRTQWVGSSCQLTSSQPGCSPLGLAFEKEVNRGDCQAPYLSRLLVCKHCPLVV